MRCLVTGADGFVGRHLVAHLRKCGDEVIPVGGRRSDPVIARRVDVRDAAGVREAVVLSSPEVIYHLASVSFGPDADHAPGEALSVTIRGTLHVLQAAAEQPMPPTVFIPGSAEVYGRPGTETPISENTPLRPVSVYGGMKAAQELLALGFGRAHGLRLVISRSFNHIGPGQRDAFVVASFATQLAAIRSGTQPPVLEVGNLSAVRDFCEVRDVVRAYRLLVEAMPVEPVNIATGRGVAVGDILKRLIELSGVRPTIRTNPARLRAHEPSHIVGDAKRIRALTGWEATIPLERTLRDVWEHVTHAVTGP